MSDSDSDSEFSKSWVEWFMSLKGNEFFCEVDDDYILDFFNLTGLNAEINCFQQALELITDSLEKYDENMVNQIEKSAKELYGLIHARYILTNRGLMKMQEKHRKKDFGLCLRANCYNNPLLPVGLSDTHKKAVVALYCGCCEDIYRVKQSKHKSVDGAYFGTTFPHLFYDSFPGLKSRIVDPEPSKLRYVPKIFGFKVHDIANIHRWQDKHVERENSRIAKMLENS
ncbi:hypothetical protein BB561_003308 [Smittium simulii]|uniref:Casein kinase II subunit beta n=1 Tax=Smittium simulii TaxID=133385 RepID=A0A2T9YM28_9FUNG|nr:hypothetical protein BB561_003308 [Smittium simulii]